MRHKDMAKVFAIVLRKYRKEQSATQEGLAERADIDPKMVSFIERFERNPSLNVADSLAQALGLNLSDMIAEAENERRKRNRKKSAQ